MRNSTKVFLLGFAGGLWAGKHLFPRCCHNLRQQFNLWRQSRLLNRDFSEIPHPAPELNAAPLFAPDDRRIKFLHFYLWGGDASRCSLPNIHWLSEWVHRHRKDFLLQSFCLYDAHDPSFDPKQAENLIVKTRSHQLFCLDIETFSRSKLGKTLRICKFPLVLIVSEGNRTQAICHPARIFENIREILAQDVPLREKVVPPGMAD